LLVRLHTVERQEADFPDRRPLAVRDRHLQGRRAEPVKQQPGEAIPGPGRADTKEDSYRGGKTAAHILAAAVERLLQLRQRIFIELAAGQIYHRLNRGDHLVPARASKKRGIVAAALIAVIVRQIDDLRPLAAEERRMGKVI